MTSYQRNGRTAGQQQSIQAQPPQQASAEQSEEKPGGMRINGFQQILDMLRAADPEFRESILQRLAKQDRRLAANLRADLK